jgi:hypothetical protein
MTATKVPTDGSVRRFGKRLGDAICAVDAWIDVVDCDERVRVNALPALHKRLVELRRDLDVVIDRLGVKVNEIARVHGDDGRLTIPRVGTVEATFPGKRTVWSGHGTILHSIAARAVDKARWDPDTGALRDEPMPPAVLAAFVAEEVAACAGLLNSSATWRKGELEKRGIDPAEFTDRVGESRPGVRWAG